MFFYKSDDDKIKINLLKIFQSLSINYGNYQYKFWDNLVKTYGVISESNVCYLDEELKVSISASNQIKVKKGKAIFPVNSSFFVDLPQDVERDILVIVELENDITITIQNNLSQQFVVLTPKDRYYFSEVKYEKTYSNPPEVGNMIYELKGKIEVHPVQDDNHTIIKGATIFLKDGKKYGLVLAKIDYSPPNPS